MRPDRWATPESRSSRDVHCALRHVPLASPAAAGGPSPGAGKFLPVPGLDDPVRDRYGRWQQQRARDHAGPDVLPGVPACLGDLILIDPDLLAAGGQGAEAEHQAVRHGPWLAGEVPDLADPDARLLQDLACDSLLRGLAW